MMKTKLLKIACTVACTVIILTAVSFAEPGKTEVLAAMEKAAGFMMNTVSFRGGFVWNYSEDLSQRWGEVPARDTQIWVQGATNGVGDMFLDMYHGTGDPVYLGYAEKVAGAIIWGQHPSGGWHYLIDFDMTGIQSWYDNVASQCWGWEEYYHYYGNCTYDNDVTTSSVRFLMNLYMETLAPEYRVPLLKGLDFILESQFDNGSWPQRYPLRSEFVKDGIPDYTGHYTFNDGVMSSNIFLLIEAWEKIGDRQYFEAAQRGMDFYLTAQGPLQQPAWAEQYDYSMQPAWGRSYEPDAYHAGRTAACVRELMHYYVYTSDKRYLDAVIPAIDWLERSRINTDPDQKAERAGSLYTYTHAVYYKAVSNRPVYVHREGTSIENGRYWADYTIGNCPCHVLQVQNINVDKLKAAYDTVKNLDTAQKRETYRLRKKQTPGSVNPSDVESILSSQKSNGSWITDISIPNYTNPCDRSGARTIKGISTRVFVAHMRALSSYAAAMR
ncbi:pectate lyase [Candidatus Omnitrophota bacterium]